MSPDDSETLVTISCDKSFDKETSQAHTNGPVTSGPDGFEFRTLPKAKKFIIITFSLVNFCIGIFYSAIAPFFPNEAAIRGVNNTTIGLIFGIFELALIVMSPIFGNFLTSVGAKFMYCSGVLVSGCCGILFGFLDGIHTGFMFSLMCLLVRTMEGIGAAAFMTASFAIMAHTFPDSVSTVFGTLELFSGLGFMVGPPIGGALYQLGGFKLPFVSFGGFVIIIGLMSMVLLPSVDDISGQHNYFILGLLRIPVVCIMCLYLILGAAVISFMDAGMAKYIYKVYNFSPIIMGLTFVVAPGVYAFTAPVLGSIADKKPGASKIILITGYMMAGLSFIFIGPAPFLPIANNHIWLFLVCLAITGLGLGSMVITFQIITIGSHDYGYSDSLETFGLISGLFNCFFSLGSFLGPMIGGYLIDKIQFQMSSAYFGFSLIAVALLYMVYCLIVKVSADRSAKQRKQQVEGHTESSPLHCSQESSISYHTIDTWLL